MSFADPLKDQTVDLINHLFVRYGGYDPTMTRERLEREKGVFRPFLQWYGTDFWRKYMDDDQHWIKEFDHTFQEQVKNGKRVVVADCRFLNEADYARDNDFLIVKVIRPESSRNDAAAAIGGTSDHDQHASEREIDQIRPHLVIHNDGTLSDLNRKVAEVLSFIEVDD